MGYWNDGYRGRKTINITFEAGEKSKGQPKSGGGFWSGP
jgi:hypothetical protein